MYTWVIKKPVDSSSPNTPGCSVLIHLPLLDRRKIQFHTHMHTHVHTHTCTHACTHTLTFWSTSHYLFSFNLCLGNTWGCWLLVLVSLAPGHGWWMPWGRLSHDGNTSLSSIISQALTPAFRERGVVGEGRRQSCRRRERGMIVRHRAGLPSL